MTLALYAANRRKWSHFEAELGLRLDAQHYNVDGNHTQVSPRLNLRYDIDDDLRLYASAGRFTQAQHVEEWRVEEAQQQPDSAQVSIHSILGLEYDPASGGDSASRPTPSTGPPWRRTSTASSIRWRCFRTSRRIACASCRQNSEASGLELNVRECPSLSSSRVGER